jgi:hypothetical protein
MAAFGVAAEFWAAVTGSMLSERRGEHGQFVTLVPPAGDAWLRVQGVGDAGGAHLDFEVDDPDAMVAHAIALGGEVAAAYDDGLVVVRSPASVPFCVMPWSGASQRAPVTRHRNGTQSRLDQVCLDLPPSRHDAEVRFWSALTGWRHRRGVLREFGLLRPPSDAGLPVQILTQRLDDEGAVAAHHDVACSDLGAVCEVHEGYGARLVWRGPHWLVMRDPAGGVYCLTNRHPETGRLALRDQDD